MEHDMRQPTNRPGNIEKSFLCFGLILPLILVTGAYSFCQKCSSHEIAIKKTGSNVLPKTAIKIADNSDDRKTAEKLEPKQKAPKNESSAKFVMVDPSHLPYPKENRKNYGVGIGGGRGVVVAPHWVMTASHCITWKAQKNNKVSAKAVSQDKVKTNRKADLVVRHGSKDVALVRLTEPFPPGLLTPPLLLKDVVKGKRIFVKKVSMNTMWSNIPASGKTDNWYVPEEHRKGKAGTSGSPWLVHSTEVGDVLVGITHGTGRAPQIGYIKDWIAKTIAANSQDTIYWATAEQAFAGQEQEQKQFIERTRAEKTGQ
jgi:hypothetical protein